MKLHKLVGESVSVTIDLDTSTVVQIENNITKAKHLLARKPELELHVPGMGIVEIEPVFCSNWIVEQASDNYLLFKCIDNVYELTKEITVYRDKARYRFCVKNRSGKPVETRLRIAIYLACGNGGFWGDSGVYGAGYNCKYYVDYGYAESWGTFSNTNTPGTVKAFQFEKHSYKSKSFPELRWIAVVNTTTGEGIVVKCLESECYGVVEDQFFNIELNLALPRKALELEASTCLTIEFIPFNGLKRVDYVDDDVIAGIEVSSIILPNTRCSGNLYIYPLKDVNVHLSGRLVYVRGMQSIGKRGYCIDRVVFGTREISIDTELSELYLKAFQPRAIRFQTSKELTWSFEEELYEIPYIVFFINQKIIKRAVSINPDVEDALGFVPKELSSFVERFVKENPVVESDFLEREASQPIYELVLSSRLNPRKILGKKLFDVKSSYVEKNVVEYLHRIDIQKYIDLWQKPVRDPVAVASTPFLGLALAYSVSKSEKIVNAFKNIANTFSELVFNNEFVTYYSAIHGGGGSDRFADFVLALDMFEDYMDEADVKKTYLALRFIGKEISKLLNTWTGNWELSEAVAVFAIAYKLGYIGSDVDMHKSLATVKRALNSFLPDGAWPELAGSYHVAVLNHLLKIGEILRYVNLFDVYTYTRQGDSVPVIKKALTWLWNILTPRDTVPSLEDTNEFVPPPDIFILPGIALNDETLMSIAFKLAISKHFESPYTYLRLLINNTSLEEYSERIRSVSRQRQKVVVFNESGRFVYREGEDKESLYMILDFGSQGGWHGHPDRLSFELYYKGVPLIVDAGSCGYYNPVHWTWCRKTIAHNTVTFKDFDHPEHVRGYIKAIEELSNGFKAVFALDIGVATIERSLKLLTNPIRVLVVRDRIRGSGTFRWNIHCRGEILRLYKDNVIELKADNVVYALLLPKGIKPFIEKGFRGLNEHVAYVFYENEVRNEGELWGAIILDRISDEKIDLVKNIM